MGGNHEQIRKWRRRKALEKTLQHRPDLLNEEQLSAEDKKIIARLSEQEISLSESEAEIEI